MLKQPLITFIFGTRPEAIKLAPVIIAFKKCSEIKTRVVLSGQHKEMVSQVLDMFNIIPDLDLDIMQHNQSLTDITSKTLKGLENEFKMFTPNMILVQGDTTTSFAASLAAFYMKIPIGHIEAGLRTNTFYDPYPEEMNRRLISQLATINFAPTLISEQNLYSSNLVGSIFTTGNTVIDAIKIVSKDLPKFEIPNINWDSDKVILTTIHRRENWGSNLESICEGIKKIISNHKDVVFVLPMHKNKIVRDPLKRILGESPQVFLLEPFDYKTLLCVMKYSFCILSDSGGIQEEAPSFKKPILILRETTERQEIVDSGKGILVGTSPSKIYELVNKLIIDESFYSSMTIGENPFGDGNASKRILKICLKKFGLC